MVCPHGRGVEQVRTFCEQEINFRNFVWTSFNERPIMAMFLLPTDANTSQSCIHSAESLHLSSKDL